MKKFLILSFALIMGNLTLAAATPNDSWLDLRTANSNGLTGPSFAFSMDSGLMFQYAMLDAGAAEADIMSVGWRWSDEMNENSVWDFSLGYKNQSGDGSFMGDDTSALWEVGIRSMVTDRLEIRFSYAGTFDASESTAAEETWDFGYYLTDSLSFRVLDAAGVTSAGIRMDF